MPDEFVIQRTNIANPPTLMLVIDALMDRIIENNRTCTTNRPVDSSIDEDNDAIYDLKIDEEKNGYCRKDESGIGKRLDENKMLLIFLHDAYAPLNDWIQWFLVSQKGPSESNEIIEKGTVFCGVMWFGVI